MMPPRNAPRMCRLNVWLTHVATGTYKKSASRSIVLLSWLIKISQFFPPGVIFPSTFPSVSVSPSFPSPSLLLSANDLRLYAPRYFLWQTALAAIIVGGFRPARPGLLRASASTTGICVFLPTLRSPPLHSSVAGEEHKDGE
jgi:hypothetical protein